MDERRDMSSDEMRLVEYAAALSNQMRARERAIRPRLKELPNGWRQWRLVLSALDKLLEQIYDTMPTKQLTYHYRLMTEGIVRIAQTPAANDQGWISIRVDDLNGITSAAINAECAICLKTPGEIRACPLRRALMGFAPPPSAPDWVCGYRNVAQTNDWREPDGEDTEKLPDMRAKGSVRSAG